MFSVRHIHSACWSPPDWFLLLQGFRSCLSLFLSALSTFLFHSMQNLSVRWSGSYRSQGWHIVPAFHMDLYIHQRPGASSLSYLLKSWPALPSALHSLSHPVLKFQSQLRLLRIPGTSEPLLSTFQTHIHHNRNHRISDAEESWSPGLYLPVHL